MTYNYEDIDSETLQGMCKYYDHIPLGVCVAKYIEVEGKTYDFQAVYANEIFEDIVNCPKSLLYRMTARRLLRDLGGNLYSMLRFAAIANMKFEDEIYHEKIEKYIRIKCSQYQPGYVLAFIWDSSKENLESNKLKETNDLLSERMNIIHSLGTIYYACYHIDLVSGQSSEIESLDKIRKFIHKRGNAQEELISVCDNLIVADFNQEMRKFVDLSTIQERMKDKNVISHEFIGLDSGWSRGSFIVTQRDQNGLVVQLLFVSQHIDEEKQKELDYQRNLEEAVETAKKANETRKRFLASMSHDIRTPINGIIGLIDMEEKNQGFDTVSHVEHMKKIRSSAEQLLSIINDVLEMSKLENGIVCLSLEEFDITDLLNNISRLYSNMKKNINLDCTKLQYNAVIGSPAHIRQILFHTVSNAVKFNSQNGKVDIKVFNGQYVDGKMQFIFAITDTGIGMKESFIKHIFEPFTQEHSGARTTYEGTGLGMAIVKRLVDEMEGTIDIKSKVNEGTTVTITIPLLLTVDYQTNAKQKDDNNNVSLSGMKALLVEDNEINAEIAQFILENADIQVTTAENGQIAVNTFEKSKIGEFDMILMDIMMPVMDGLEATREIRALKRTDAKKVPIIAVSANTFPDDVQKTYDAGMDGHVPKPISSESLISVIKQLKS